MLPEHRRQLPVSELQVADHRLPDDGGQVLSGSFADYAIPTAAASPRMETLFTEDPTSGNPLRVLLRRKSGGGERD